MRKTLTRFAITAATVALGGTVMIAMSGPASASTVPTCSAHAIAVSHTPSQGGAGHGWFVLLFRNVSHSSCSLKGFPGFSVYASSGHKLANATRTRGGYASNVEPVARITVKAGQFASATAEWDNFNPHTGGDCPFAASVAVTTPNTTAAVHFSAAPSACGLQIHPILAGTSNNAPFAKAQIAWKQGATASSARENDYWLSAATDLSHANGAYTYEINELFQLSAIPETSDTPAQIALARKLVRALNSFFGTQTLYR